MLPLSQFFTLEKDQLYVYWSILTQNGFKSHVFYAFFSHLISFSQKLFLSAMRWNRTIPLISIFTEAWPYARLSCNIVCIHYIVHVKYMKKMRCIFKMLYKFSLLMWAHLSLLCPVVSIYQYFAVKVPWKCWYVILQYTVIHNTQFEFH